MRYTGPKNRMSRREGIDLGLKTSGSKAQASLLKRISVMPGQVKKKHKRKLSEHGRQLREKQKLRYIFGLTETQLKNYFKHSIRKTGNTGLYLSQYLETRLDNVVYRLGFAPTRAAARQLVSHKHIKVNDKIANTASYHIRVGDKISFAKETSTKMPAIETAMARNDIIFPAWIERKDNAGSLIAEPTSEIIEKQIILRLVIEFYSR